MKCSVGILVYEDNHFIVRGPEPDDETALRLVRAWTFIGIGTHLPQDLNPWQISTREFRENLEWAIVVHSVSAPSPAVKVLLEEMQARGISLHTVFPNQPR